MSEIIMKRYVFLICIAPFFFSCSIEKAVLKRLETRLPKGSLSSGEVNEDVDFYMTMVERICPYPYMYSSKTKIDSLAHLLKTRQAIKPKEFYLAFSRVVGGFNVGHMYSQFPATNYQHYKNGRGVFPLSVDLQKSEVVIDSSFAKREGFESGNVIVSINGFKADSLVKIFLDCVGGLDEYKRQTILKNFDRYLWLSDITSPFSVEIRDRMGMNKTLKVNGYKPPVRIENKSKQGLDNIITYNRFYDSVAFIDFKSMAWLDDKAYDDFLKNTFRDIQLNKTTHLIIDLRSNSGGRSILGEKLLNYVTDKPFTMSSRKEWWVSKEYKSSIRKMFPWYVRPIAIQALGMKSYFKSENEKFLVVDTNAASLKQPGENELRYTGKTYFLIGNKTFSSAMMVAGAVADFDLCELVGEPTGEPPNDLGEIAPVRLPNSGIVTWIPSALFVRPNGDRTDTNPILPDYGIISSEADVLSTRQLIRRIISNP